jgi:hypothetical protein
MFKPGDIARVRQDGRTVTIERADVFRVPGVPKWPISTTGGIFDETDLIPAHPSVIATAEGRDLSLEARRAENKVKDDHLSFELRPEVAEILKKAFIDFNGHWKNGSILAADFRSRLMETPYLGPNGIDKGDAESLLKAAAAGVALDCWLPIDLHLEASGLRTCFFCGEEGFTTETNGQGIRFAGKPCKFPNGLPPTEWELNVPSGKLVVANDLRDLFPLTKDDDFDTNTTIGCRQTTLTYAANGLSHAFIGNSCPGVFKCGDGLFKISNPPSEEEFNGRKYVTIEPAPKFEGERVAGICTDLWWYSICDHEEFKRRLKHFKLKTKDFQIEIIDLKPGVYRFRHNEDARSHDGPKECVYTWFEWVREPDPVQNFLSIYEQVEVNANAYVQAQVARWPTLYGKVKDHRRGKEKAVPWANMTEEDRLHSWQAVADRVFCAIGGGTKWHDKGFPTAKIDPSVPDVDIPSFRAQYHWYPFSKPYGGLFEPKTLTPSFAKLAFRVLESVISFGMHVGDNNRCREVPYVRERMLVAVKRYRELAKKYPTQADPEYVAWLSQKGRAEAWVEKFDLGPTFTKRHEDHAKAQRWVPEDAYAVEFDARKLKDGHFAWHPKKGGWWAAKKDAQRYAISAWEDNGQAPEHNCFWSCHATNTSVPLYSVARVVKVGQVSHTGETLVEVAFDYGTPWMRNSKKRKALAETGEKAGIRLLSKKEYESLLPKATQFFETAERGVSPKKKAHVG